MSTVSTSRKDVHRVKLIDINDENLELREVPRCKALFCNEKDTNFGRILCAECGLTVRHGIYNLPDYLRKFSDVLPVAPAEGLLVERYLRRRITHRVHPCRDVIFNTYKNIEELSNMQGGAGSEKHISQQILMMLLFANRDNKMFWDNMREFEAAVVHVVKVNMDELMNLFYPFQVCDDAVIQYAKPKVIEAIEHHEMLRLGMEQLRHEYRMDDIRGHMYDLINYYITGGERQAKCMSVSVQILPDVISSGIAKDRTIEIIACAIVCLACSLSRVPPPCMETLARGHFLKAGAILGLKTEIHTKLAQCAWNR